MAATPHPIGLPFRPDPVGLGILAKYARKRAPVPSLRQLDKALERYITQTGLYDQAALNRFMEAYNTAEPAGTVKASAGYVALLFLTAHAAGLKDVAALLLDWVSFSRLYTDADQEVFVQLAEGLGAWEALTEQAHEQATAPAVDLSDLEWGGDLNAQVDGGIVIIGPFGPVVIPEQMLKEIAGREGNLTLQDVLSSARAGFETWFNQYVSRMPPPLDGNGQTVQLLGIN